MSDFKYLYKKSFLEVMMKKLPVLSMFLGLMTYALEKVDITTGIYTESENRNAEYNEVM